MKKKEKTKQWKASMELRTPKQLKLSETAHGKWSKKDISIS